MMKKKMCAAVLSLVLLAAVLVTGCDDGLPSAPDGGVLNTSTSVPQTTDESGSTTTTTMDAFLDEPITDTSAKESTKEPTKESSKVNQTTKTTQSEEVPNAPVQNTNTVFDMATEGGNLTITDKQGNVAQCEYISLEKGKSGSNETWSDFTFIGGKLWVFVASGDEVHTKANGQIRIYHPETGKLEKTLYHDFGHANTVDYNVNTDRLLIGNLPGNDTYPSALYIFDDVSSWMDAKNESTIRFADNITTIVDVSNIVQQGTTHATNTAACWGEADNIVYINGSFNRYWWKVTLGAGTNKLAKGTYVAADAGVFNGTYKIAWMRDYVLRYSTYQECVQGMVYYNGDIHTANGHNEIQWWEWKVTPSGFDRSEHRVAVMKADESIDYSISEGIAIYNGYLYIGCLFTGTGSDEYAANHSVCQGEHGVIKVKLK